MLITRKRIRHLFVVKLKEAPKRCINRFELDFLDLPKFPVVSSHIATNECLPRKVLQ